MTRRLLPLPPCCGVIDAVAVVRSSAFLDGRRARGFFSCTPDRIAFSMPPLPALVGAPVVVVVVTHVVVVIIVVVVVAGEDTNSGDDDDDDAYSVVAQPVPALALALNLPGLVE